MNNYRIYIKSNNHARNINTPMMARTYYDVVKVQGKRVDLVNKVKELLANGEQINEIRVNAGGHKIYMCELGL